MVQVYLKEIHESINLLSNFLTHVLNLKSVQRQGWVEKLNLKNPESVADHTYSMSVIGLLLGDLLKLDTLKILKMTLLHDLAESLIGDLTPKMITKSKKNLIEDEAMQKILKELPSELLTEYYTIWKEYQSNSTKESIIVHEIDKFEMVLQAMKYSNPNNQKQIQTFLDSSIPYIQNEHLQKILIDVTEKQHTEKIV